MRRDLIIGVILSLGIHAGILFGTQLLPKPKPPPPPPPPATVELMPMPPLEPEPQEIVEQQEADELPQDFAPPMLADVPQLVKVDSFIQPLQPPPPEGIQPASGTITIPTARQTGLGRGIKVFDISDLDEIPTARGFRAEPQYPFEMRRADIEGEVVVEFIVDTHGNVRNAFAVSSTHREFEQPAVEAVSKWKFKPGRKGGRNQNTRIQIPIVFSLDD